MPQMAPMNWTLLFTMFISLYLVTLVLIYFTSSNVSTKINESTFNSLEGGNLVWKW